MGYLKIGNLYKDQRILLFKEVYCLEKVHGTSAHVSWRDGQLHFFSGGERLDPFTALFDRAALTAGFETLGCKEVTVYGEAYGGKCQGMRETYGDKLAFIAFDVKIGESWLDVPNMAQVCAGLGLEVVPWEKTTTDIPVLDELRDRFSEVAVRRGCGSGRLREGVVLRPLIELVTNNGERLICKHKGAAFEERTSPPKVEDPDKLVVLANSTAVADEWCNEMRLSHVLDKLQPDGKVLDITNTKQVIEAMVEDVLREAKGEIVESKETKAAIGRKAAQLFKARLQGVLK
jgi:hypothetical protein